MHFLTWLTIVSVIVLPGIVLPGHRSEQRTSDDSTQNESVFQFYEFPSHPDLTHLCQQRVYGSGHEITWDAFASSARPSKLVDYYHHKLGNAGLTRKRDGASWRLPADAPRPNRTLEIISVGSKNPSSSCEKSPPPASSAIVLLSRIY